MSKEQSGFEEQAKSAMDGIELSALTQQSEAGKATPLPVEDLADFRRELGLFMAQVEAGGMPLMAPPFLPPDLPDPKQLAEDMAATAYRLSDLRGPILSFLWHQLTAPATDLALEPLKMAGERMAADMDRGVGVNNNHAYHNRQHTAEVLLNTHVLLFLADRVDVVVEPEKHLALLIAALVHDWHHDGTTNGQRLFRLEHKALAAARPYLEECDVSPPLISLIEIMVLATDLASRPFVSAALNWHRARNSPAGELVAPPMPALQPGCEPLAALLSPDHALTCELAMMLGDADILGSTGLTGDLCLLQNNRLQDEWATNLGTHEYLEFLHHALGHGREAGDPRPAEPYEKTGKRIGFWSLAGEFFNPNIPAVVEAFMAKQAELAPEIDAAKEMEAGGIDFSIFEETRDAVDALSGSASSEITPEGIKNLHATMEQSGYFESPPFTLNFKSLEKSTPGSELARANMAEYTADTLQRLHSVPGPVVSAIIQRIYADIGLGPEDPITKAAAAVALEIDRGHGTGTKGDIPDGERNPYHNTHQMIDVVMIAHALGQRAAQRGAPASSPMARGLLVLAGLICQWHHTGSGNKIDNVYRHFYLQDRALEYAEPLLGDLSKDLRGALQILVRTTDPREPFAFTRLAYNFHIGLLERPDIPPSCEPLARLLGDPALCTLSARLNDALFVPFVGLTQAYSAKCMVQLGREIGVVIDFNFVRKNLITPLLSRPPYPGEKPPPALILGKNRIASFTCAEAQALFNPGLHSLLASDKKV